MVDENEPECVFFLTLRLRFPSSHVCNTNARKWKFFHFLVCACVAFALRLFTHVFPFVCICVVRVNQALLNSWPEGCSLRAVYKDMTNSLRASYFKEEGKQIKIIK